MKKIVIVLIVVLIVGIFNSKFLSSTNRATLENTSSNLAEMIKDTFTNSLKNVEGIVDMGKTSTTNNIASINKTIMKKTAGNSDGNDWANMNSSQKNIIVSAVITSWKDDGSTIDVNSSWFINALDSFYNSPNTKDTNVESVIATAATTADVVH